MRLMLSIALFAAAACNAAEDEPAVAEPATSEETMLVAGGCFWCVEADLEKVEGVREVVSGYAGGTGEPTYDTYSRLGHREVAQVIYDPEEVSFEELGRIFLRTVDVTDDGGQFCDRGYGYTTAIYYDTPEERQILERLIAEGEEEIGQDIVTPIEEEPRFTPAEDYHQDYYKKSSLRYSAYRRLCGRDRTVRDVWGQTPEELLENAS